MSQGDFDLSEQQAPRHTASEELRHDATEPPSSATFHASGTLPPVAGGFADHEQTASDRAFGAEHAAPRRGGGVHVLRYYLHHGTGDVDGIAHIFKDFPADHHEMFRLLHRERGAELVEQVVHALEPTQPPAAAVNTTGGEALEPPVLPSQPLGAMPSSLASEPSMPAPPAVTAAAAATAEATHAAEPQPVAPEAHVDAVPPEVWAKYVAAARMFLARRFQLTADQAAALEFKQGAVIGGALNLEVNGMPDVVMPKPDGTRSSIENDYNDNFYTNLPKDIRPPGAGRVAHVMCNDEPLADRPGMVRIHGPIRMHFDIGNPEDVVGGMKHIFGDLLFGQLHQRGQGDHVKPIK